MILFRDLIGVARINKHDFIFMIWLAYLYIEFQISYIEFRNVDL